MNMEHFCFSFTFKMYQVVRTEPPSGPVLPPGLMFETPVLENQIHGVCATEVECSVH